MANVAILSTGPVRPETEFETVGDAKRNSAMDEKIEQLEIAVAHLQHAVDQLNAALVEQAEDLNEMRATIQILVDRVTRLSQGEQQAD